MVEIVVTHLSGSRRNAVESFASLPVKLGRADDNHVKFDADKDIKVSAHHAELRSDGQGGLEVVDLSKNGVSVNGAKVDGKAPLPNHAVVELGGAEGPRVKLKYEMGSGGISFSKLKKPADDAEAGPARHLRTTAEAEAYTESDLAPTAKVPPKQSSPLVVAIAAAAVLAAIIVLVVVMMR